MWLGTLRHSKGHTDHKSLVERSVKGQVILCVSDSPWVRRQYIFRSDPVPGTRTHKASIRCCRCIRSKHKKVNHDRRINREVAEEISEIEGVQFHAPSKNLVRRGYQFDVDPWDDIWLPNPSNWKESLKKCPKSFLKHKKHGPYVIKDRYAYLVEAKDPEI